jgi:hypothetical protein
VKYKNVCLPKRHSFDRSAFAYQNHQALVLAAVKISAVPTLAEVSANFPARRSCLFFAGLTPLLPELAALSSGPGRPDMEFAARSIAHHIPGAARNVNS